MDWKGLTLAKKHSRREIYISEDMQLVIREINIIYGGLGAATWDGGVVLSKWIAKNGNLFHQKTALELGCGVGISGIVAAKYAGKLWVSDYLPDVLENAKYNFRINLESEIFEHVCFGLIDWHHFLDAESSGVKGGHVCTKLQHHASYVEQTWFRCKKCFSCESMGVCESCYRSCHVDHSPNETVQFSSFRCDCADNHYRKNDYEPNSISIIFGSELVYSTLSCEALASTVDYLLAENGVFYQVLQSTREGVDSFCRSMGSRGFACHITRVPKHYHENTNTRAWSRKGQEAFLFYTWRKPSSTFPIMQG